MPTCEYKGLPDASAHSINTSILIWSSLMQNRKEQLDYGVLRLENQVFIGQLLFFVIIESIIRAA